MPCACGGFKLAPKVVRQPSGPWRPGLQCQADCGERIAHITLKLFLTRVLEKEARVDSVHAEGAFCGKGVE